MFNWEKERRNELYKIILSNTPKQILGLLSLQDFPSELRVHLNLIELAQAQIGKTKVIDHIAGCLIAFACALAFKRGYEGFVSLLPKTELIDLYTTKYGFQSYGQLLAIETTAAQTLIEQYL